MTIRIERGPNTSKIYAGGRVVPAFRLARTPRQRDAAARCWLIPTARLDDFLAALDVEKVGDVELVEVTR